MTSDPQDLISLIRSILKNRGAYAVNEQATKQGVVLPLVARLGWDRDNILEVAPEYAVGSGRVDYCLKQGDVPAVFLEVKRLDEPLDDHQKQLLRYAFEQGVTIAALTDGVRWWLYLPTQPGSWEQRRFFTINLEEQAPEDVATHFRKYLGKPEVLSGSALRDAKELHESRAKERQIREAIPAAWYELCGQPDSRLIELLSEKVEGRCGHKPDPEDLERFIVGICGPHDARTKPPGDSEDGRGSTNKPSGIPPNEGQWTFQKPVSFTFLGTRHQVGIFKDILVGLAAILYEKNRDQFWPRVSQLGSSRGKDYYTRESDRLRAPRQIGHSGIWVETYFSANDIRERCHELLAAFGYRPDDLRVELRPRNP
jgi:hypothetical protein